MSMVVLSEEEQQRLIALEFDLANNLEFEEYLTNAWTLNAPYALLDPHLRYLKCKQAAVQYLMGRTWMKRDWQIQDRRHRDGMMFINLKKLHETLQEEIDTLLGRQRGGRPPASGIITAGTVSVTTMPGTAGPSSHQPVTGALGSAPVAPTQPPRTPVPAVPEVGVAYQIDEGGFSQLVLTENGDRNLISVHNTSPLAIWIDWDKDAQMGSPSRKILPGATWGDTGDDVEKGELFVVGSMTGQTFIIREDSAGDPAGTTYDEFDSTIEEGGISQLLVQIDTAGQYLLLTNTSTRDLWYAADESATMGAPSVKVPAGQTVRYNGIGGFESLEIVGPSTGQTFHVRVATLPGEDIDMMT